MAYRNIPSAMQRLEEILLQIGAYDVGRPPKNGRYRDNARLNDLVHLQYVCWAEEKADFSRRQRRLARVALTPEGCCLRAPHGPGRFTQPLYGAFIYVVSPKGNLYVAPNDASRRLVHANLLAGRPLQCAGELLFERGYIVYANNSSGHYRPFAPQLKRTWSGLAALCSAQCNIEAEHASHAPPPAAHRDRLALCDRPTRLGVRALRRKALAESRGDTSWLVVGAAVLGLFVGICCRFYGYSAP